MRIIFVRHGEPDYEHDCLTDRGLVQAEAAAARLEGEGIEEILSSPMGRARQTAQCTARRLRLPVRVLEYMHEISWGGEGIPHNGHPWTLGECMIAEEDFDFYAKDWRQHPYFEKNAATGYFDMISEGIDGFMSEHGYRHEGSRFFCSEDKEKTVALFSHGGSGACALSHLLTLPFPYVSTVMPYDYTSVTVLAFPVSPGEYVHPRIELFNDHAHIRGISEGLRIQEKTE